jgi:hypothetical protein
VEVPGVAVSVRVHARWAPCSEYILSFRKVNCLVALPSVNVCITIIFFPILKRWNICR